MRPVIIGVGGSYSRAGKTLIASFLLKNLKGWGAIKYTKTDLYSTIIQDESIILEEGKDTKRLYDAGAEKVVWVKAPYEQLSESLNIAIEMLGNLKGIVIEGNSAVEIANPEILIFVFGSDKRRIKKGIEVFLKKADIIVYDKEIPPDISKKARIFKRDELEDMLYYIKDILNRICGAVNS